MPLPLASPTRRAAASRLATLFLATLCLLLAVAGNALAARGGGGKPATKADTAPPSVAIGQPSSGSTVSGTVSVAGTASDNKAVSSVEVSVDGGPYVVASGTGSWTRGVDTTAYADGSHVINARATDSSGNRTVTSVSATFANAAPAPPPPPPADTTSPQVAFSSPAAGATVSGTVTVSGTASDDSALSRVEVKVDGGAYTTVQGTSNWTYSLDTRQYSDGSHTLTARATDGSGNTSAATRTLSFQNSTSSPATPTVKEQMVTPEGATIQIYSDVSGWTAQQVYDLLRPNAYQLSTLGPKLTIKVQTTYASSTSAGASQVNGVYSNYSATIYLKATSSSGFQVRPDMTLTHEYGHAWTLYHLYMSQNGNWSSWLQARSLAGDSRVDSTYNWSKTEMIADDYRMLFGTATAVSQAGYINSEATDPRYVPGLKDFFVNTWARSS